MADDSQIDAAIFGYLSTTNGHWRKVAMVIIRAEHKLNEDFPAEQADIELIANRIVSLVEAGRLLAQGDLTKWRHSEVKVP